MFRWCSDVCSVGVEMCVVLYGNDARSTVSSTVAALRQQLQQSRQHVDQYKAIASSVEQTLVKQTQVWRPAFYGWRITLTSRLTFDCYFSSFAAGSLSLAHSSLMFQAFTSLLTMSFHHNFSLPLGRVPSISFPQLSDVFSFFSSFNVSEPFPPSHDHRYDPHPCFLQDLLISPVFQQAHSHCRVSQP